MNAGTVGRITKVKRISGGYMIEYEVVTNRGHARIKPLFKMMFKIMDINLTKEAKAIPQIEDIAIMLGEGIGSPVTGVVINGVRIT